MDVITDPVPDADAQPAVPTIAEGACDKLLTYGAVQYSYAEFQLEGTTVDALASAGVLLHQVTPFPASYPWARATTTYVADGKLLVLCELVASADMPRTIDFARLIMP